MLMDKKRGGTEEPETIVSQALRRFSVRALTPFTLQGSKTRPDDVLGAIPADAGTLSNGTFDSKRFSSETGVTTTEYISLYLKANGPRVRQQELVRSLAWSDATVSRLLKRLEEDGVVETYTLGRENVICLPGTSPSIPEEP